MFSVLTSVAIFPFRLVTLGAGFALTPRLVAAPDGAARRQVVKHELQLIGFALTGITIVVCVLSAYFVARWTTAGRYDPDLLLVLAACLIGAAKVAEVLPRAIITACGSERDLVHLSGYRMGRNLRPVCWAHSWAPGQACQAVLVRYGGSAIWRAPRPAIVVAYRALLIQPEPTPVS